MVKVNIFHHTFSIYLWTLVEGKRVRKEVHVFLNGILNVCSIFYSCFAPQVIKDNFKNIGITLETAKILTETFSDLCSHMTNVKHKLAADEMFFLKLWIKLSLLQVPTTVKKKKKNLTKSYDSFPLFSLFPHPFCRCVCLVLFPWSTCGRLVWNWAELEVLLIVSYDRVGYEHAVN